MVSFVTIQGGTNKSVYLGFDSPANAAIADQIAANINSGVAAGTILTALDSEGTPPTVPAGVTGALVQSQSGLVKLPKDYTTDLVTKPGQAVVFGNGSPDETIVSGVGTNLTFIASAGSGTVVAGGGNNRVSVTGPGDWSLNTGDGNDVILALGAVNATIGAGGGGNSILLGSGADVVLSTGNDSIIGGSGTETVDATGAHSDFVRGNSSHLLFIGGSGGATILGGSGSDTYFGSPATTGKQLIEGGKAGNNVLFAGDGVATLVGGGTGDQLFATGAAHQMLRAGAGNETLSAALASGSDTLRAGSGHDVLIGGSGADTFVAGMGSATIQAGSGSNLFEFVARAAGGDELIQGISDPASIKIALKGFSASAVDDALATQRVTNGSVTIGLTDGTKVTFQDVTSLSRSNFV